MQVLIMEIAMVALTQRRRSQILQSNVTIWVIAPLKYTAGMMVMHAKRQLMFYM